MNVVLIPVVFILAHLDRWFRSEALQDVRTIVKKRARVTCLGKFIPFRFYELLVDRESDSKSQLRIPERLCLVQSDLKGMIIDCFNAYIFEVWSLTFNIIIQALDRVLNDVEHFRLVVSSIFDTCNEVICRHVRILFPFWIIPFGIITKFVSISQAILRNCPIFSKWRNQISILVVFKQSIDQVSCDFMGCSFTRCDVVQVFRFCLVDVREFLTCFTWLWAWAWWFRTTGTCCKNTCWKKSYSCKSNDISFFHCLLLINF